MAIVCPKCGYQHSNVECYWPRTSGYVHRADTPPQKPGVLTTTAKPGDPYVWWDPTWTTTVTTYKHKPRKRRHYRQVVY